MAEGKIHLTTKNIFRNKKSAKYILVVRKEQ